MDQTTARRLARLINTIDPNAQAIATTEDANAGRWPTTHTWIVTTANGPTFHELPEDTSPFGTPDDGEGADTDAEESDNEFPHARPPRLDHGCPACGAEVTPTRSGRWPQHGVGGDKADKCDLSGVREGFETNQFFGTFYDRDTSPKDFGEAGYYIATELEDFGNAFGLNNRLIVPSEAGDGKVVAQVRSKITQGDYLRFRDELDRLARRQGWITE